MLVYKLPAQCCATVPVNNQSSSMKVAVVVCAVLAIARGAAIYPASTTLVEAPQYDSAVIQSDRLGGNFAYSTLEAKAYAAVSPVVQNVLTPVGISYSATPIQYPAAVPAVPAVPAYPAYPAVPAYPAFDPAAVAPVAPLYPAAAPFVPAAPGYPVYAPIYPAAPAAPASTPIVEEAPAAPEAPAAAEPAAPSSDAVETSASSDDSVTIEAA